MNEKVKENITKIASLSHKYYCVLSAFITMGILFVVLRYGKMLGGDYVFINADLYDQCAPFAKLYISKILEGSNLYYSFKTGMGMNTSLILSFGVLSPFNLLYLFAGTSNINEIAILIFVTKAGLAALAFQLFSKYNLKVNDYMSIIISVGYALSSYGMAISYSPSMYDGIYLLPLVLMAVKYYVDKKQMFLLTILYAILFVTNFYSGYIVGFSSFIYLVLYCVSRRNPKDNYRILFVRYFVGVGCSFLLSGFVLAPTLYDVINQRAFDSEYNYEIVPLWNVISSFFPFVDFKMSSKIPYLYCGVPTVLLAVAFFCNSKIKYRTKIIGGGIAGVVLLSMLVEPLYSLAHMFNDPTGYTYRYAFIVALFVCSIGLIAYKNIEGVNVKKAVVIYGVFGIAYLFSPFLNKRFGTYNNSSNTLLQILSCSLIIIWAIIIIYCRKRINNYDGSKYNSIKNGVVAIIAIIIMCFEVGINSYILITSQVQQKTEEYEYTFAQADLLASELEKMDNSLYRIHYEGIINLNQACLYDYNGSTLYATSNNQKFKEFLYNLGISCTDFFIQGKGTTDLTKLLLDEKYDLGAYTFYESTNANYIIENCTAGFGFMVDEKAINTVLDGNVFENQNIMYSALLGEDVNPYIIYDGDTLLEKENVVTDFETGIVHFYREQEDSLGYLNIMIPESRDVEMYAWLSSGDNTVNSMSPVVFSPDNLENREAIKPQLMAPHIIKMSQEDNTYDICIYTTPQMLKDVIVKECYFAYYDKSYIMEVQEKLAQQSFDVTSFEDGKIEGNITAKEEGVCFMSIPYEEGWSAIVDGESCEIIPIFDEAFIGVPLQAGYHDIELIFEAPYSRFGAWLSVIGIALLVVLAAIDYLSLKK